MNEKSYDNKDNVEEEELNELPGYIQSIINDFYSFDKKETPNKKEESKSAKPASNIATKEENNELNSDLFFDNDDIFNKKEEINTNKSDNNESSENEFDFDINKSDLENDTNIENIFNSKKDFFNKPNDENNKENIDPNIQNKDANIKLYSIQENNLFNIKRSFRLQSILQNNYIGYKNNTSECSICYRKIQNYGLLSNCDDVFCYDCIKQWRTEAISKNKREMFRRCPICNFESPMLIKSKNYVSGDEKRKKFYELKQEKKNSMNNQ